MTRANEIRRPTNSKLWGGLAAVVNARFLGPALMLMLLGVGVFIGIWKMDLMPGDTAAYYAGSSYLLSHGRFSDAAPMVFSPLYCGFLAIFQALFAHAGTALVLHRVLLVLAIALATFAMARRLLPRWWAWLVAAWWLVLPIDWRAFFEVHLFSHLLVVAACAAAGASRSWIGKALALTLLSLNALFVRNEYALAAGLFFLYCAAELWRQRRKSPPWKGLALIVLLPAISSVVILLLICDPRSMRLREIRKGFEGRQRVNVQQVYAFGYAQRHPEWKGDPWLGGATLLKQEFGAEAPTFGEAGRANWRALAGHALWNLRLLPAGLQYGLFNGYGGATPPDFAASKSARVKNPWPQSIVVVLVGLAGLALLYRWWQKHHRFFLRDSRAVATWVCLLCAIVPCVVAILTQRPRPSYIFPLTLGCMIFTALSLRLCLGYLRQRLHWRPRFLQMAPLPAVACLLIFIPGSNWSMHNVQPRLKDYGRLRPFQARLIDKRSVLVANTADVNDVLRYLGRYNKQPAVAWRTYLTESASHASLLETLQALGATDLYCRGDGLPNAPKLAEHRDELVGAGWRAVAQVDNGPESWEYWSGPLPKTAPKRPRAPEAEASF